MLRFAGAGHRVFFTFFSNLAGAKEVVDLCAETEASATAGPGHQDQDEDPATLEPPPSPLLSSSPAPQFSLVDAQRTVYRTPGGSVTAVFLDQGEMTSIQALDDQLRAWLLPHHHNTLDVLVNNAALGSKTVINYVRLKASAANLASTERSSTTSNPTSPTDIFGPLPQPHLNDVAMLRVNTLGPIWLTSHLTPYLSPRARILFIGSVGGNAGIFPEYRTSDLASKAALGYAAKHLAARWLGDTPGGAWGPEGYHHDNNKDLANGSRERGWTVITVAPGATQTAMFKASNPNQPTNNHTASYETFPPKGRLIEPGEIAELVYFCGVETAAEVLHGGVVDASLGLGSRWGVQTERARK